MPKEVFLPKKPGDPLTAAHINHMGRVLSDVSGVNQGTGLQGSSGWIRGVSAPIYMPVVIARVIGETSEDGIYEITLRYWDEVNRLWKDNDDEYLLDARCFTTDANSPQSGMVLADDQRLSVKYDKQRGMYVPIAESRPGAGGTQIISFRVLASGVFISEADIFCARVRSEVLDVSCCESCEASVAVGDEVDIWDPNGCYFNVPVDILLNARGTAVKMAWDPVQGISGDCFREFTPEEIAEHELAGQCWWMVTALQCVEEWHDHEGT